MIKEIIGKIGSAVGKAVSAIAKTAGKARGAASSTYNWARANLITKAGVLAKRANQRLREIEKQGLQTSSNAYRYVERVEYDETRKGSKYRLTSRQTQGKNKGKIKFNTNFKSMTDEEILKSIKSLDSFLNAPTSLTKGVRSKINKLTDKFNKKLSEEGSDVEYTEEEFSEIMSADLTGELFKIYDPSDIMRLMAQAGEEATKAMEDVLRALVEREHKSISELASAKILTLDRLQDELTNWSNNTNDEIETPNFGG